MKTTILLFALLTTALFACKKPDDILPGSIVITNVSSIDTIIPQCTGLEIKVTASVEYPSTLCEVYNVSKIMAHSTQWFERGEWSYSTGIMYNNGPDKMTRVRVTFPGGSGFIRKCVITIKRM